MESGTTDPVKYPSIVLSGTVYELKFRLSDMVRLQKAHQIDLFVKTEVAGVAALERMGLIIQAGITHQAAVSLDDIMDSIELGEVPTYALAIAEAQKKASPESIKALKLLQEMAPKPAKSKQAETPIN